MVEDSESWRIASSCSANSATTSSTRSGEEALLTLADGGDETFDAVFTDVVMPGMSGLELAAQLGETRPDMPVILTTGYSDEIATSGAGGLPVILKPYRPETLAAAIDLVLGPDGR